MLTSTAGPMWDRHGIRRPGEWRNEGGGLVLLDATALGSLQAVTDDFRVAEVERGVYEMHIGRDRPYPVLPADCGDRAGVRT